MAKQYYYGFVLGRNPAISATEIYLRFEKEITKLFAVSSRIIIVGLKSRIFAPELTIDKLYGTVKIIEFEEEISSPINNEEQLFNAVRFKKLLPRSVRRIVFGFSAYNIGASEPQFNKIKKGLIPLAYKLKKDFKNNGYNASFLGLKADEITTNTVKDNQLIEKGADFAVVAAEEGLFIGKTVAIQNTQDYEKRNYHRPARNLQSGIMPIKLARAMIALSGASLDDLVIDPFCGSGTIITELILMGFTNIVGSDNDATASRETETNIKWLFDNYPQLEKKRIFWEIKTGDAKLIGRQCQAGSIKAIISEPYLGPILKTSPSKETVNQLFAYLTNLYLDFFRFTNKCLKNKGRIVFIFPAIPVSGRMMYLDILPEIQKAGFKPVMLLPKEWQKLFIYEITGRNSFLVKKEGQILVRELFVFEKTRQ